MKEYKEVIKERVIGSVDLRMKDLEAKIRVMFAGHEDLIVGFRQFLPKETGRGAASIISQERIQVNGPPSSSAFYRCTTCGCLAQKSSHACKMTVKTVNTTLNQNQFDDKDGNDHGASTSCSSSSSSIVGCEM